MTQLSLHPRSFSERIAVRVLAALLWRANAIASRLDDYEKHAFYAIKDRILTRWADAESLMDVQKIVRECRGCYGTGEWRGYSGRRSEPCQRCNGTGVYRTDYFGLARYNLAGRVFHRPVRKWTELPPDTAVTIDGHVKHTHPGRAGWESLLWLALLFNRRLFRHLMRDGDAPRRWTLMPLTNVHQTVQAWRERWCRLCDAYAEWRLGGRCAYCRKRTVAGEVCDECIPF